MRTPPDLPSRCDGCGESFSFTLQHGLDCLKSGRIIRRQNKIRDCLGDLAALVWPQHIREPMVQEGDPASDDPGLRRNLGIWGVWQPQAKMLFDICVIGTDASSYRWRSPVSVLESEAVEKKFTIQLWRTEEEILHPLVYCLLQCEALHFVKRPSTNLVFKSEKSF